MLPFHFVRGMCQNDRLHVCPEGFRMGCCCFILSEACVKMIGCMCVLRASGWGAAVSFCQISVSEVLAVAVVSS